MKVISPLLTSCWVTHEYMFWCVCVCVCTISCAHITVLCACLIEVYRFGELFAGAANVTTAVKLCGIPAFKMDKVYYEGFDFLAPAGFSFLGCF